MEPIYRHKSSSEAARRDWLTLFRNYRFGILRDVPNESGMLLTVGRIFGQIRSTSWGEFFDVKARSSHYGATPHKRIVPSSEPLHTNH